MSPNCGWTPWKLLHGVTIVLFVCDTVDRLLDIQSGILKEWNYFEKMKRNQKHKKRKGTTFMLIIQIRFISPR
jgi:hypothetical protein